jgi:hypothetical protein
MDPDDSAGLDRQYPEPELATLHAGDLRTEVKCGEQSYGSALGLSRCSLLSGRGAESRAKREPEERSNDYHNTNENQNTNGFFCRHNRFLLSLFMIDEIKKGPKAIIIPWSPHIGIFSKPLLILHPRKLEIRL